MTRDALRLRRSRSAIAALSTLAAATLAGCSWMSPVQTDHSYAPADGVSVQLGEVKVTNLLLVSSAEGEPGVVVGQVTNGADQPVELTIGGTGGAGGTTKKVPAHGVLRLQESGVAVPTVAAAPGAMTKLVLGTPSTGAEEADVPVLAPEGAYATVTPSASGSRPAPTHTITATTMSTSPGSARPTPGGTAGPSQSGTTKPSQSGTAEPSPSGTTTTPPAPSGSATTTPAG